MSDEIKELVADEVKRAFDKSMAELRFWVPIASFFGNAVSRTINVEAITAWVSAHPSNYALVVLLAWFCLSLIKADPPPKGTVKWVLWQVFARVTFLTVNKYGGSIKLPGTLGEEVQKMVDEQ